MLFNFFIVARPRNSINNSVALCFDSIMPVARPFEMRRQAPVRWESDASAITPLLKDIRENVWFSIYLSSRLYGTSPLYISPHRDCVVFLFSVVIGIS